VSFSKLVLLKEAVKLSYGHRLRQANYSTQSREHE